MIPLKEQVKAIYNTSSVDDLKDFPRSERDKYYKTGNRQDFEKLYFRRRDFLSSCAFLALTDNSYIPQLEEIILAICNEYCWALPAHTDGTKDNDYKAVDLFVAETSFSLAEIITVLADKLSKETKDRVKTEIEKRLVNNYKNQNFWWEDCNMNWASVCGGFTGGTLIYLFPEEFEKQKSRILNTLKCYIDGFSDDGMCYEGADYWIYGFSAYTYFADLLYKVTNGETDLFADEKVRKIAGYMEKMLLMGNTIVSFSDANVNAKADLCLQHYLSRRIPEYVHLLSKTRMSVWGGNTKWPCFYRTNLWVDNRIEINEVLKDNILKNQMIIHKQTYSFALKGGNNDEPHNHNDLGSFIFSDENGQALCDLGAGRYTKDYFNENRYGVFCNSSLSHNVPIINNNGQSAGGNYFAEISYENNRAVIEMTNAYNEENLKSFKRHFDFQENSVLLTDKFETENQISIVERFVTLRKPKIIDNAVILDSTCIIFDKDKVSFKINENAHTPHEYDAKQITVYCLDFELKNGITEVTFNIKA